MKKSLFMKVSCLDKNNKSLWHLCSVLLSSTASSSSKLIEGLFQVSVVKNTELPSPLGQAASVSDPSSCYIYVDYSGQLQSPW
jgi:hypothetical protein